MKIATSGCHGTKLTVKKYKIRLAIVFSEERLIKIKFQVFWSQYKFVSRLAKNSVNYIKVVVSAGLS